MENYLQLSNTLLKLYNCSNLIAKNADIKINADFDILSLYDIKFVKGNAVTLIDDNTFSLSEGDLTELLIKIKE